MRVTELRNFGEEMVSWKRDQFLNQLDLETLWKKGEKVEYPHRKPTTIEYPNTCIEWTLGSESWDDLIENHGPWNAYCNDLREAKKQKRDEIRRKN